jgi:hypothetical protein
MQGDPAGKANIVLGHSIGNSKQNICVCTCVLFRTVSEIKLFPCTDEQHAMSSPDLRSAFMLTVEFSKMYYTR